MEGQRPDAQGCAIGCVYRIVALHTGTHRMRLSFPLPPKKRMQDEDVHHYVSYIVGHESKGGILAELKAKGWATYLAAGVGDGGQTSTSGYRIFVVQILLTPVGLREWVQVAGVLFQFVGQVMMKGKTNDA
jgi:secreted Zn-dependent insulinase-like peptidase